MRYFAMDEGRSNAGGRICIRHTVGLGAIGIISDAMMEHPGGSFIKTKS